MNFLFLISLLHLLAPAPNACASPAATSAAFAVVEGVVGSDTLATVTICLVTDPARLRVGGYHGELTLPRSARVVKVDRPTGGTRIENTNSAGRVSFAGVASDGMRSGALLGLAIARRTPGDDALIRLTMLAVTDIDGRDVASRVKVDSLPHRPRSVSR
jgi:hypothetical protein